MLLQNGADLRQLRVARPPRRDVHVVVDGARRVKLRGDQVHHRGELAVEAKVAPRAPRQRVQRHPQLLGVEALPPALRDALEELLVELLARRHVVQLERRHQALRALERLRVLDLLLLLLVVDLPLLLDALRRHDGRLEPARAPFQLRRGALVLGLRRRRVVVARRRPVVGIHVLQILPRLLDLRRLLFRFGGRRRVVVRRIVVGRVRVRVGRVGRVVRGARRRRLVRVGVLAVRGDLRLVLLVVAPQRQLHAVQRSTVGLGHLGLRRLVLERGFEEVLEVRERLDVEPRQALLLDVHLGLVDHLVERLELRLDPGPVVDLPRVGELPRDAAHAVPRAVLGAPHDALALVRRLRVAHGGPAVRGLDLLLLVGRRRVRALLRAVLIAAGPEARRRHSGFCTLRWPCWV
mmetsp:Transcript_9228/g.27862  ORF Transcript_9228/g.27862 Transcript_9228/m.27862 type:complete len:407 (+) Transcript_9228:1719-2939(+)